MGVDGPGGDEGEKAATSQAEPAAAGTDGEAKTGWSASAWVKGLGAVAGVIVAITGLLKVLEPDPAPKPKPHPKRHPPAASTVSIGGRAQPKPAAPDCSRGYFLQTASGYTHGFNFEKTEQAVQGDAALAGTCFAELAEDGHLVFGAMMPKADQSGLVRTAVTNFGSEGVKKTPKYEAHATVNRRLFWIDDKGASHRDF